MKKLFILGLALASLNSYAITKGRSDIGSGKEKGTMSCPVYVMRAGQQDHENLSIIRIKLDGEETQTFEADGVQFEISLYKRLYADAYDIYFSIPNEKNPKRGPYVTFMDVLINEGPAKDNGFTPDVKPGSLGYDFVIQPQGIIGVTTDFSDALKQADLKDSDLYGKRWFPAHANVIGEIASVSKELMNKGLLKKDQFISIGLLFSCTKN